MSCYGSRVLENRLGAGRQKRTVALGFAALTLLYLACVAANPMPSSVHGDGFYTYLWARSIVFDGDLDLHRDYQLCGDPWGLASNPIGADINYWNVGSALFWVPILAFDRATGHAALRSPNPRIAAGCTSELSDRAVMGSLVAGLLACWLAFAVARRYFGDGPALFGAVAIGALGPLLYYATMLRSYGHATSSCGAALALWAWDRQRRKPHSLGAWMLMGGALGLTMLIRAQNAIFVVLPLATWIAHAVALGRARDPRALVKHAAWGLAFTAAVLVVFSPQLWIWHHMTGSWITVPQGDGYMRWGGSMWHKALFSAQGLFPWSPIHYLALAGMLLIAWHRPTRALGVLLLVLFAAESYVVGAAYDWSGSVGFPGRRFDALTAPFAIGLAALGRAIWHRIALRRSAPALAACGMLVVLGLWNVSVSVGVGRAMRTDTARRSPDQWRDTFGQTLEPLWKAVGNPLTWPASIPFALRYHAHPRRWDVVGAPELFHHDERTLRWRPIESTMDFSSPVTALYVDGDLEPTRIDGGAGLALPRGSTRIFVPLHGLDVGWFEVRASPIAGERARVSLSMRGYRFGTHRFTADDREHRYPVPAGVVGQGIHELWLWVEGDGVLLERIRILDPDPPPSVDAAKRNEELRRLRRRLTGHGHD